MADEILKRDSNHVTVLGGITNDVDQDVVMLRVDPVTKRLLVSATGAGGTPGGSNTQVQFNDGGVFGGDAAFTFDKTTDTLNVNTIKGFTTQNVYISPDSEESNITLQDDGSLYINSNNEFRFQNTSLGNQLQLNVDGSTFITAAGTSALTLYHDAGGNQLFLSDVGGIELQSTNSESIALISSGDTTISPALNQNIVLGTTGTGATVVNTLRGGTSGGVLVESNSGTDVALFGAGGGAGATFYGGVNITGNLGIAGSATNGKIDINNTVDNTGMLAFTNTGANNVTHSFVQNATGISGLAAKNLVLGSSSGASDMAFSPSSGAIAALTLKANGNIGIWTTNPTTALTLASSRGIGWELSSGTVDTYLERYNPGRLIISANNASDKTSGYYVSSRKGLAANSYFSMYGVNVLADDMFTGARAGTIVLGSLVASTLTGDAYDFSFWTGSAAGRSEKMTITKAGNVGIGITAPLAPLELRATRATIAFESSGLTGNIPFTDTASLGAWASTSYIGAINQASQANGGLVFQGFTNSASASGFLMQGHVGSTTPTASAISFSGWKSNGTTGRTAMTGAEKLLDITPGAGTAVFTLTAGGALGLGDNTPATNAKSLSIASGTLASAVPGINVTMTMPTSGLGTPGEVFTYTGAGSNNATYIARQTLFNAGYTGPGSNLAGQFFNQNAGTGTGTGTTSSLISYRPVGNQGLQVRSEATTTGNMIGGTYLAGGGNVSIAGWMAATSAKNSATNVGLAAFALNTGTSPIQVGGYFALADYGTSMPTFTSAALIADNGGTTSPIFLGRDNGTTVFSIVDGGNVGVGTATPGASASLDVSSTTRGFLPPRMTTAQRDAISSPAAGLVIYNTTTNKHQGYDGSVWNDFY